jgi:steroid 5-alpha reductase family enzyme
MITTLIYSLLIITAVNVAAYIWAYFKQSDHLTDISYSLCFIGLSAYLFIREGDYSSEKIILLGMVTLWGLRLGGFLFYRISKMGKDYRFDAFRSSWSGFLKFWILQSVSIWIIALPVIFGLSAGQPVFFKAGFSLWLIGWIIEAVADYQKFVFKSKAENRNNFITSGLYSRIRHPNYLGEILIWTGIFIYTIPVLSGWSWLAVISPVWLVILLVFISGIPLIDSNAIKKYGNDPAYKEYRKKSWYLLPYIY